MVVVGAIVVVTGAVVVVVVGSAVVVVGAFVVVVASVDGDSVSGGCAATSWFIGTDASSTSGSSSDNAIPTDDTANNPAAILTHVRLYQTRGTTMSVPTSSLGEPVGGGG